MAVESMHIVSVGVTETTKALIRTKLRPLGVEFHAPNGNEDLTQILSEGIGAVSCVLIDGSCREDGGRQCCAAVRSVDRSLPVLILSSRQDRNYYVNAIRWGASGFIVKPIRDDALRAKLMECYAAQAGRNVEIITFDLGRYLAGEFRKAEKGHFSLTFMLAAVVLDDPAEQGNLMSHAYYLNLFHEAVQRLFWETDAFIRLNFKYCLGVFPFCGKKNVEAVTSKIHAELERLYEEKNIPASVRLVTAFASYPDDAEKFLDVQSMLAERARALMGDDKLGWFVQP